MEEKQKPETLLDAAESSIEVAEKTLEVNWLDILNNINIDTGIIVGVVGVLLAIYTILRKNEINLHYEYSSSTLIKNHRKEYNDLNVTYKRKPIENLTLTRFILMNGSNAPLRKEDIPKNKYIEFSIGQGNKILNAKVIDEISSDCNFDVKRIRNNTWKLVFHHINPKNAVLIHVLHTGNASDKLNIVGKGANLKSIVKVLHSHDTKDAGSMFFFGGILLALLWVFKMSATEPFLWGGLFLGLIGGLGSLWLISYFVSLFSTVWVRKLTKEL